MAKFPLDPYQKDFTFTRDVAPLQADLCAQMKQSKPDAVTNAKDFSLLNVIKADYKMQQRQKEIVSVISDMSAQMS